MVCDAGSVKVLVGVLPMSNLLFVRRSAKVADVMIGNPLSVRATMPLDELVDFFDSHHFLGVPVVDDQGVLLGVIHREAVDYAANRATENDYLKSQGIVFEGHCGSSKTVRPKLGVRTLLH